MFKDKKNTFFCFSPAVMLATFIIEIILAVYVFARYKMNSIGRLVSLLILVLAGFQLAEYLVCAGSNPIFWSRLGFVLITILPVAGLKLAGLITGKSHFLKFGYVAMLAYILIFLFAPKAITGAVCGGNYIIFETVQPMAWTYGAYYFGFLLIGIWEAVEGLLATKKASLYWLIAGYVSFLLPMSAVYLLYPEAQIAVPSIMCGFALILAFILAFKVAVKK